MINNNIVEEMVVRRYSQDALDCGYKSGYHHGYYQALKDFTSDIKNTNELCEQEKELVCSIVQKRMPSQ